jgi:hypothetical protein
MQIEHIALKLQELVSAQQFRQARQELYANDVASVEAEGKTYNGLQALEAKHDQWHASIETVYQVIASHPLVNGQFFAIAFTWDMTYKGQSRHAWHEIGIFQVRDGKVIRETFFY